MSLHGRPQNIPGQYKFSAESTGLRVKLITEPSSRLGDLLKQSVMEDTRYKWLFCANRALRRGRLAVFRGYSDSLTGHALPGKQGSQCAHPKGKSRTQFLVWELVALWIRVVT